jgi:hypothetical protein
MDVLINGDRRIHTDAKACQCEGQDSTSATNTAPFC